MFKRAYTAAVPDLPAAVVNCLRVSPRLIVNLTSQKNLTGIRSTSDAATLLSLLVQGRRPLELRRVRAELGQL